jgi:glycosyltransferase involved in cell wall biosynthesis
MSVANIPKVSILITVYNHEKYIRQCLDSILGQKTNFNFEVVIGEDCSPDNSRAILIEYAQKHPEIIIPILYEVNQGSKECPGKGNFVNTFYKCRGKFIVHIEADDYLIDDNKLQIQYDYLNNNPTASACFHNTEIKYEVGDNRSELMNPPNQKQKITPEDLLYDKEVWFIATASVMFRRNLIGEKFPEWFLKTKSGDIPLYCMLANKGTIDYIPKIMSVYRKHAGGLSYTDIHSSINFINNRIGMYSAVNKELDYKYDILIKGILAKYYLMLANSTEYGNNPILRLWYTLKSILKSKPDSLFETIRDNGFSASNYHKYLNLRKSLNRLFN